MAQITVSTTVTAPIDHVWDTWNNPIHITNWAFASDEWHAPFSENDLVVGGKFTTRMEAKEGDEGFDFGGVYTNIVEDKLIEYKMEDERTVSTTFEAEGDTTKITQTFDAETTYPEEYQKAGWQAILDNYKKYTEETA